MKRMFQLFRSFAFLITICISLALSTVALAVQTVSLTAQVATAGAQTAALAVQHRKALAKAVTKAKAKARLRRALVALPLIGIGLAAEFERRDYLEWQEENPEGSFGQYSCEVATVSAEVIDEVLQELPERVRPSRDRALSMVPDCLE